MSFGDWLREQRDKARISQAELERAVEKSRGYLARVESGAIRPTRELTDAIAAALRAEGERRGDRQLAELTDDGVWAIAAPFTADHAVRAHYEAQLAELREHYESLLRALERRTEQAGLVTVGEHDLLEAVRRFRVQPTPGLHWVPDAEETTSALAAALRALHEDVDPMENDPTKLPVYVAASAVVSLAERSAREQHRAWGILQNVLWLDRSPRPDRDEPRR